MKNNDEILKVAESYHDLMELAYEQALKNSNDVQYFLNEQKKHKVKIYNVLPNWLISALEAEDYYHLLIIKNERTKERRNHK